MMLQPFCLLAASLLLAGAAQAEGERSGPGHALGAGFYLGGYAALGYRDDKGARAQASLENLSGFIWWEAPRHWSFFAELEVEDALVTRPGKTGTDDADLMLERLHLDYAWSDALQLRAGKFLTPIGRWNPLHAAPLTWTSSRPLITDRTFPTNATGLMLHGVQPLRTRALEWSVYTSLGEELFAEHDLDTFTEAVGLRLDYAALPTLQVGLSLADFEQRFESGEHKRLYSLDLQWRWQDFEVLGEWALRSRDSRASQSEERGYYLQGVVPLSGDWYGVVRYETIDPSDAADFHHYLGGIAWRLHPGWVLKAEASRHIEDAPGIAQGVRASLAVFF